MTSKAVEKLLSKVSYVTYKVDLTFKFLIKLNAQEKSPQLSIYFYTNECSTTLTSEAVGEFLKYQLFLASLGLPVISKNNEKLEAELLPLPHMPSELQAILKAIFAIVEYITTIRLSSKYF